MGVLKALFTGITHSVGTYSSFSKVSDASDFLSRLISEGVSPDEFLKAYNMRIYDYHNKQNDIKIMKSVDFAGVYIINNQTKKICLIRKAGNVLKKIDRHFRGYECQEIYKDFKNRDQFSIRVIRLENSGFSNISELEKKILEDYSYLNLYNDSSSKTM